MQNLYEKTREIKYSRISGKTIVVDAVHGVPDENVEVLENYFMFY